MGLPLEEGRSKGELLGFTSPRAAAMFADASDNVCDDLGDISCPFCQAVLLDSSQSCFYGA